MKKETLSLFFLFFIVSCKIQPGADRNHTSENRIYKLRLNPPAGSQYHFEVSNEVKLNAEIGDKEIDNVKKTEVAINYEINKDSAGNFLLGMTYDKIHLHTKNGDDITDLDAANGASSSDPVERMLGALKAATITATVSPAGNIKSVKGYQDVANRILSGMNANVSDKAKAQMMWQQMVEQGIVKKNMDQLFKVFPDSAVHVGDKWKLYSTEKNDISFTVRNFYTLRSIEDGVANIESAGEIETDSTSTNLMGYNVTAALTGKQEGVYSMDITTGMLISCKIKANIEGTMQMVGREVKMKMRTEVSMDGQKIR
jgi:hypothetical protein